MCVTSASPKVGADTIRRAQAVHPISDLQIEYSLISRGIEDEILLACFELGIGITAYGVLSRGLISGHWSKARAGEHTYRSISPRFQGTNLDANLGLVERLRTVADAIGASVAQVESRGWRRRAPISFPWLAPAGAIASTKLSARWISLSRPRISRRWQMRCRPTPFLASAIQSNTSHIWTARMADGIADPLTGGREVILAMAVNPGSALVTLSAWAIGGHMLR
jgi:hypothetical protein